MLGNFSYGSIDCSFSSSLVIETMSRDFSGDFSKVPSSVFLCVEAYFNFIVYCMLYLLN